jgi:uncharacterized protein (DUF4213/DUF364 family)
MATEITWYSSAAVIHTVYFTWILHTRFSLTNHQLIVREEIKMWEVYDRLIETVPADLTVSECMIGMHWTLIRSKALGMALTPFGAPRMYGPKGASVAAGIGDRIAGMSVGTLAQYLKSWNPYEASLGLAAINSALNSPEQVEKLYGRSLSSQGQVSAFVYYAELVRGKKVAVVGRFPDLETLTEVCQLTVLERAPGPNDLPDPACEYVLPEQDYVFITATALTNKTFPRLLQLSYNAFVFLVGPSTPFAPFLFDHGIHTLAGTVVLEPESVWQAAQEGAARSVFDHGAQMVKVSREDWEGARRSKGVEG